MNNELIQTLRNNLKNLLDEGELQNNYVVLFGMNTPGDEVIHYLAQRNISVKMVLDNNPMNKGKKLAGVNVDSPAEVLAEFRDDARILICSRYFSEMASQLENMGYSRDRHIFRVLDMCKDIEFSTAGEDFDKKILMVKKGLELYKKIEREYGAEIELLLSPVKANGDVYITSAMMRGYKQDRRILFGIIGGACKKITAMFCVEDVVLLTQEEMEMLVRLSVFLGEKDSHIKVVQPYYLQTNIMGNLEGYKGLNFADFFGYGYMKQKDEIVYDMPEKVVEDIEKRGNELGLIKGKTVILAPYANSLPQIAWSFWIKLARELKRRDYTVYTNSASKEEIPVPGTYGIFFHIGETPEILSYAGTFISMRNGLCEVASTAKCKQIIIYPDKSARHGSLKDVYGISAMGLNIKVHEFVDGEDLLEKVLEVVS